MSGKALVDLAAIRHNVGLLREHADGRELMAVVKADGYGHGAVPVARAALEGGATRLGVAFLEEALELRRAGIEAPLLAWILPPGEPLTEALEKNIELSAGASWLVDEIADAARRASRTARIHLKADTGISRGGAPPAEWPDVVRNALKAQEDGAVEVVGLWSHFACADEPGHPSIQHQLDSFEDMLKFADKAGIRGAVRHIANSAATVNLPAAQYDMVRPGIAVYGLSPIPQMGDFGLRQAMTLTTRVPLVKRVPQGSGVSYGWHYVTDRETTLGLVPLGYADGILRHATNLCEVLAAGRRRRVAGRVCMDQFMFDVGDDALAEGDEVVLFGPGDAGEPTAQEWADRLGTITHEITTRIGSRVSRVYIDGGSR